MHDHATLAIRKLASSCWKLITRSKVICTSALGDTTRGHGVSAWQCLDPVSIQGRWDAENGKREPGRAVAAVAAVHRPEDDLIRVSCWLAIFRRGRLDRAGVIGRGRHASITQGNSMNWPKQPCVGHQTPAKARKARNMSVMSP
jgi:hypothetical protein